MSRRQGRAYLFIRWSGGNAASARLGDVGWAFENIDTQGKFYCFHYGATDIGPASQLNSSAARSFWTEKCFTLPELTKAMSTKRPDRPGYDEVKVFQVSDANPDAALQLAQRLADAHSSSSDPLEETRQVLSSYGVKGLTPSRAFSAPFLWYNILPGRSVPIRRLAIHLFELRAASNAEPVVSLEELEIDVRRLSETVSLVRSVGECFVTRVPSGYLVAINIAVDPQTPVVESRRTADRVGEAVRALNPNIRHLFVQVLPDEKLF
jgi:hypothetical protein